MADFTNPYAQNPNLGYGQLGVSQGAMQNTLGQFQNQNNQNISNENVLQNQLQQQAIGLGPNLAQSQLQNANNQNMQAQAAMTGSMKGVSPAEAAQLSSTQGTQTLGNAAAQSAQLRAQQQMGAQQQLAGLQGQIGQQQLGAGQLGVGTYQNIGQQGIQNALGAQQIGAAAQAQNTSFWQGLAGPAIGQGANLIGSLGSIIGLSHGGQIQSYDDGGGVSQLPAMPSTGTSSSSDGFQMDQNWQKLLGPVNNPYINSSFKAGQGVFNGISNAINKFKTPGGTPGGPGNVTEAAQSGGDTTTTFGQLPSPQMPSNGVNMPGDAVGLSGLMAGGGKVNPNGTDDSTYNDVVPAKLSPGEVVIPRSIANGPDAGNKAKSFLEAIKKHHGKGGYEKVASARKACGGKV